MNIKNSRVLVVGAGLSGIAVCRFLLTKGAQVLLYDGKTKDKLSDELDDLAASGVILLLGNDYPEKVDWQLVIVSPGVPPMIPILSMSRDAGLEIIGEMELAFRFAHAPFIGITGTNGKTTTTALTGYITQQAGYNTMVGGNIGKPLVDAVEDFEGIIVAELSSFQLESCIDFFPHIAVYLNLTPDHLDRHGSIENYQAAKEKIFAKQGKDDFAVLNYDDSAVRDVAEKIKAKVFFFSLQQPLSQGLYLADGQIYIVDNGQKIHLIAAKDIYIKGMHNWQNAMAAAAAAYALGIKPEQIADSLRTFPGVEHRLEFVCEKEGIIYINDSKGTNPDSTTKALEAYDNPIVLIAGGYDKGADFLPLMQLIKQKVRHLVLLGATAPKIKMAADQSGFSAYELADTFEEAVGKAEKAAQKGDIVMLSPACASWGMFNNFEERGRLFKELVKGKK